MSRLNAAHQAIIQWGKDRNFYHATDGTTPLKQFTKLMEEFGEMCRSISKGKDVKDDLGDQFVVLTAIAELLHIEYDFEALLQAHSREKYEDLSKAVAILASVYGDIAIGILDVATQQHSEFSIGSAVLILADIANTFEIDFVDCVEHSYSEIKDRKGKMVNRIYVKESDL